MIGGRLQTGINTLQGFKEDKRNMVNPVTYINYGPFSSYALTYDSSSANVSKEDSDLIYSFYGEENSQPGPESIADYLAERMSRMADNNILDALTSGKHSKQLKETETDNLQGEEPAEKVELMILRSGAFPAEDGLGDRAAEGATEGSETETKAKRPQNIICLLAPTSKELQLVGDISESWRKCVEIPIIAVNRWFLF
ncbi:bromodomain-containing protein 7-like [Xyrauchen texanus]|uniref:bromodomain-containing protein 7-like n=1 Tax=Xyrauchen texanus TaxID=154827 RepID=UPI0022422D03|nr:bromodomain-containing protein 7-like [Xyrauchen texanus]XP_051974631.1 bromodomain-containing protein 7-like [Xyrauchen texanus]